MLLRIRLSLPPKGLVGRKFELACPPASPTTTKNPMAAPVCAATTVFDPNYDCNMGGQGCHELLVGDCIDSESNGCSSLCSNYSFRSKL